MGATDMWRWLVLSLLVVLPGSAKAMTCTVLVTGMAFGDYDQLSSTHRDTTGTMTITCLGLLAILAVELGPSQNGSMTSREMSNGTTSLSYQVYLDALRTLPFGNGSGGTSRLGPSLALLSIGTPAVFTLYGRLFARQVASVGSYSDTLTVTLSF